MSRIRIGRITGKRRDHSRGTTAFRAPTPAATPAATKADSPNKRATGECWAIVSVTESCGRSASDMASHAAHYSVGNFLALRRKLVAGKTGHNAEVLFERCMPIFF